MINLFNIPNHIIDTSKFSNLLHDNIVQEFTNNFCQLGKLSYGCAINSATSAIFILAKIFNKEIYKIPTMIPPVVPNAITNAGAKFEFIDDYKWVGHAYKLYEDDTITIWDSAHALENLGAFTKTKYSAIVFSFYPTKPLSGADGGMICTNNPNLHSYLQTLIHNGASTSIDSWKRNTSMCGWKMYMSSIQAYIVNQNLQDIQSKLEKLKDLNYIYNSAFSLRLFYLRNNSQHLYRILVDNREDFMEKMKENNIMCGIHYNCAHLNPIYNQQFLSLPNSEFGSKCTVSIPFHENLTQSEIKKVIKCVKKYGKMI